jgi:O-antigen/teichoic acid export membrane protein
MLIKIQTFLSQFKSGTTKLRFISNTGWLFGERVYSMILSLFVGLLTARYLGPSNYGLLNYGYSFVSIFLPICVLGFDTILVNEIVKKPSNSGTYLGSGIAMRVGAALVSIILIDITVFILNPNNSLILFVTFVQSCSLVFRSFDLLNYWFQSKLASKFSVIARSGSMTIVATFKVYLLIIHASVALFAFSYLLDALVVAVLMLFLYNKGSEYKLKVSIKISKYMFSSSYHFMLSSIIVVLYMQMDVILIGQFLGTKQVGFYSAAMVITGFWVFVPNALIESARPIIMGAKESSEELYLRRLKQLYCVVFWLGVFVAVIMSICSGFVVNILYGSAYSKAAIPLSISIWGQPFAMLGVTRGIWIVCEHKNKYTKYYVAIGFIFNLVLNIIAIPIMGIVGSALATFLTQIVVSCISPIFYKETKYSTKLMIEAIRLKFN